MNSFFQTFAFTYLLYPILGLILVGLGVFIAKKNALLGFLDYGFMPKKYH